jgi:hypothetical protein
MKKVQRAVIGGYIKADVDGLGNFVIGKITKIDTRINKVEFISASDEVVVVPRTELYSSSAKEYESERNEAITSKAAAAALAEESDALSLNRMAQYLSQARTTYVGSRAFSGKKSAHCNDVVAQALEGKDLDEVKRIAATRMHIDARTFEKWSHLNSGHQRMLIGIALRKHLKEEA